MTRPAFPIDIEKYKQFKIAMMNTFEEQMNSLQLDENTEAEFFRLLLEDYFEQDGFTAIITVGMGPPEY